MPSLLITCPESAHRETIDVEISPLGLVVRRCSAYGPDCAPACARTCARGFDLRRRETREARIGTVLELRSCLPRT